MSAGALGTVHTTAHKHKHARIASSEAPRAGRGRMSKSSPAPCSTGTYPPSTTCVPAAAIVGTITSRVVEPNSVCNGLAIPLGVVVGVASSTIRRAPCIVTPVPDARAASAARAVRLAVAAQVPGDYVVKRGGATIEVVLVLATRGWTRTARHSISARYTGPNHPHHSPGFSRIMSTFPEFSIMLFEKRYTPWSMNSRWHAAFVCIQSSAVLRMCKNRVQPPHSWNIRGVRVQRP